MVGDIAVQSAPRPCFFKNGRGLVHIFKEHIVCLISDGHVCNLYLSYRRTPIVINNSFQNVLSMFSDVLTFVRRGSAVNLHHVSTISDGHVNLAPPHNDISIAYTKESYQHILTLIDVL